jgi:predicted peptidase
MNMNYRLIVKTSSVGILLWTLYFLMGSQAGAADLREHVVERTYSSTLRYRCIVSVPDEYDRNEDRRWPLILFLHGGGMPKPDQLKKSIRPLTELPAIVVAPLCPPSPDGPRYTKWDWKQLGEVVREIGESYRVDEKQRSVIGFSMGGSGAWELPSYQPKLFSKCVVMAGVCHPWSLRQYPKTQVWVFVGEKDYMRKEQQETVTSAKRFGVDVVETVWKDADHSGIFRNAMSYQIMLNWLVSDEDLRDQHVKMK